VSLFLNEKVVALQS